MLSIGRKPAPEPPGKHNGFNRKKPGLQVWTNLLKGEEGDSIERLKEREKQKCKHQSATATRAEVLIV